MSEWHSHETSIFTGDGGFDIRNLPRAEERARLIVKAVNRDHHFDTLVKALEYILSAEKDFRNGMPEGWEGDPLTDACASAREALAKVSAS